MKQVFIFAAVLTLSACSGGTAQCNDAGIKAKVIEIITSGFAHWGTQRYVDNGTLGNFGVSQVQTTAHDENVDSYSCEANLTFDVKGTPYERQIQYDLSYLEDEKDTSVAVYGVNETAINLLGLAGSAR